jgi:hypothetical protein
MKVERF